MLRVHTSLAGVWEARGSRRPSGTGGALPASVSVLARPRAGGMSLSDSWAQFSPVPSLVTSVRTAGPGLGTSSPFGLLTGVV